MMSSYDLSRLFHGWFMQNCTKHINKNIIYRDSEHDLNISDRYVRKLIFPIDLKWGNHENDLTQGQQHNNSRYGSFHVKSPKKVPFWPRPPMLKTEEAPDS